MKDIKIFEEIANSKGYDIALITTFNFDVNFFERCMLGKLYENGTRKISMFNDSKELNKAISKIRFSSIGKRYMVNPIEMKGAFHPKLILLLGMNKAKLFIASANVTANGYYINNEIFNYIEYNEKEPEGLAVINDAIKFFEKLNELSYQQDLSIFEEIKNLVYYNKDIENKNCKLVHNLEESILKKISQEINNVKQIDIAVPYYDNELNAIKQIKNMYPEAKINLYLQNGKCKFNKEKSNSEYSIKIFDGFKEIGTNNFYHGKVFRFITEYESYILYGSANCTESALIKTIKNNGNIECSLLEKGSINEFDYFFDNFKLELDSELSCNLISYKNENNENYYYKYGKIETELKLYLGCKNKKENIKVLYENKELKYKYIDEKNLEVIIEMEDAFSINDIFEIKIFYEEVVEKITCWFINKETLELNRNTEIKEPLNKFEIDSKDDKYLEDRTALIKAMNITYEEYINEIKNKERVINDTREITEEDEDDDGIINYVIPTVEEIEIYNRNETVKKIRNVYLERYLNNYVRNKKLNETVSESKETNINEKIKSRRPTTNEISFRRFVRSRINEMLKANNYDNIDIKNYFSSILIFNEIFDKYTIKENVEGLFDIGYIIDVKKQFIFNLLNLVTENIDKELKTAIILMAIETVIKNKYINNNFIENYKLDNKNKEILLKINELFGIRENVEEYINISINGISEELKINLDYSFENWYIDNLFGFKTEKEIINFIKKEYENNVQINYYNKILKIESSTKNITRYLNLKQNVISEVANHYKNYNKPLENVIIKIENLKNDYSPNADPIKYIVFEINLINKNYIKKIERKSKKIDNIEYNRLQYI